MTVHTSSQAQDLEAMIEMCREAIAYCEKEGIDATTQRATLEKNLAAYALLPAAGHQSYRIEVEGTKRALTDRPAAGSAASNQFGTFQVKFASEAQTRYIGFLLESRDLSRINASTVQVPLDVDALRAQVAAGQVNKRAASAIIDRLRNCPEKAVAAAPTATAPARAERTNRYGAKCVRCNAWIEAEAGLLAKTAEGKWAADHRGECPAAPAAKAAREIVAGAYIVEATGTYYRVYLGQNSGRLLVAEVVGSEFEYKGSADRALPADARPVTPEEAAYVGHTTSRCVFCARRLDVPESVKNGYGPHCAKKYL